MIGWPAVEWESRDWELAPEIPISRTQRRQHLGAYRAAVVAEIAPAAAPPLDAETIAMVDDATAEIARFDATFSTELLPFGELLLRTESASSSQIERLTASARNIALAELGASTRRNADVIVANVRAMETAIDRAPGLDAAAIIEIHRQLLESSAPSIVGQWRRQQVWVGGTPFGPHRADFVPPHHERVAAAIDDLVAFMARDDLPALTHAALAHAQFETIHPFPDGNGRTGRALLHAFLRAKGLTRNVVVPLSAGLLTDVDGYFEALTAYRLGDPAQIVRRVAGSAFLAIANARELAQTLHEVRNSWNDRVRARSDSSVWPIADLLIRAPVVDGPLVQREVGVRAPNALRAIERLEGAGILVELTEARRNRRWAAPEILDALDAFAARSGRRQQP